MKIKQLCHLRMSENNYPVTWNYISGQRPQLQQCKSQTTAHVEIWQWHKTRGYTKQFHVHGDLKIRKIMDISISICLCSVTGNIQF